MPNGVWPAEYDNSYLFGDFVCGKIFRLTPDGSGGFTRTDFVTGLGSNGVVAMTFGPHQGGQALYYTTYNGTGGSGGQVRRIASTGTTNRTPNASLSANPTSGPLPLMVNLDGSGSSDPDAGDTLTYLWDFGDGSGTQTTTARDHEPHLLHQGHIHRLAASTGRPRRPLGPRHGAHRRGQPSALRRRDRVTLRQTSSSG